MTNFGRITSVVIASSLTGGILLERVYDPKLSTEMEELLKAFLDSAEVEGLLGTEEEEGKLSECCTSSYKKHNIVFQRISNVVLFCTGTLDQNHARVAKVIECFLLCLIDALRKEVTEERIVKNYAKVCLALDEILVEGIVESLEPKHIKD